jgi:pyruvate dehydrogenase E1 component beta subunit
MTYREQLTNAMSTLAGNPSTRFIGYGLRHGRAGGTFSSAQDSQIIETPVAENLMAGIAIGHSLAGNLPVLYFERFDFVLNAADAIVNHLAAARYISKGEFAPAVIIRVVIGNHRKPLFTGKTHTQDFSRAFAMMVDFPVLLLEADADIGAIYHNARAQQLRGVSTMICEKKDFL